MATSFFPSTTIITTLLLLLLLTSVHAHPLQAIYIPFVRRHVLNTPTPTVRSLGDALSELGQLGGDLKNSSTLQSFLGDHGNVITQNDVVDKVNNGSCATMTVLFARGTFEPGNVGVLTGPPFFTALAAYMNGTGNLNIQGVDYDASLEGFEAGGSAAGSTTMASLINSTLSSCPTTKLVVSGYSQGAQLVHKATSALPNTTTSRINSIVMFGDPDNGTAIAGVDAARVMTICATADAICKGKSVILPAHLEYSADAGMAAMFALAGISDLGITSARRVVGSNFLG